ncbi:hypothetical protein BGZ47_009623, partial [Haplosporangium gracile]
ALAKTKYFANILRPKTLLFALLAGGYSFDYISQYKSGFEKQSSVTTRSDNNANSNDSDGDADDREPLSLESEGGYRSIRSSLYRLYQRYNVVMNNDKYMLPKDKICDLAINRFITFSAEPSDHDTLLFEFDKFYSSQVAKIETEIDNIFTDERTPFTMNKYYHDKILKSRKASAEEHIQRLVNNMQMQNNPTGDQVKATLRQHLYSFSNTAHISDINYNEQLAIEDLQEQMKSYCKAARKRIVDVLLL